MASCVLGILGPLKRIAVRGESMGADVFIVLHNPVEVWASLFLSLI